MELLLASAVVLFAGVLLSGLAHRTILSTAVLFLLACLVLGEGVTGRPGCAAGVRCRALGLGRTERSLGTSVQMSSPTSA